ncbi:MAG: methyltransferase domain-containing protein [Armatimonadota bacterium]|nr:methyltransferase domain-containing protein [Armatimonadota bacterium]MDR7403739.1 methyltransferase domain-containing protein [Armatimonadota bacterium]
MIAAAATDLGYLLLALADVPAVHVLAARWSRRRYARLAAGYDAHIACCPHYGIALDDALSVVDVSPRRILDVSTGTGFAASALARRFPAASVVACDLSLPMLLRARGRLPGLGLVCADAGRLPFADGAFDLVVQHNAPPPIGELARVVAEGGRLVVAFSSAGTLPDWLRAAVVQRLRGRGLQVISHRRVGDGWYALAGRPGVRR